MQPPPQDSKALRAEEPTPIRSGASTQTTGGPSAPSSSSSSTAAAGSTTFALELQAQNATLDRLRRWQAGALPASLEWHELVPPSVLLALDPPTAERQGLLWEIFRSEMEYVRNLEAGLNGFFTPLSLAPPSVLVGSPTAGEADRRAFIHETFFNLAAIFPGHSQMVYRLQERQLESHPVVDAIADILIEALIELLQPYELYLKQYVADLLGAEKGCLVGWTRLTPALPPPLPLLSQIAILTLRPVCARNLRATRPLPT